MNCLRMQPTKEEARAKIAQLVERFANTLASKTERLHEHQTKKNLC